MRIMTYLIVVLGSFSRNKLGAVAVEYAFLAAFVAIAAAVGMVLVGPELREFFTDTNVQILNAGSGNFTNDPIPS